MARRFCARHGMMSGGGPPCSCSMGKLSRLIEPVVLLLIRDNPGIHGYDLLAGLEKLAMTDSEMDAGAVYRTLRQLEANGMVVSNWDTSGNGPARRLYSLTPAGFEHLSDWALLIEKRKREMERFLSAFERRRQQETAAK